MTTGLASVAALTFVVTAVVATWLARRLVASALVAQPTHRSNHTVPTPTGGGIALISALVVGFWALHLMVAPLPSAFIVVFALAVVLAIVFLLDDLYELSPLIRLAAQFAAVGVGTWLLPPSPITDTFLPFWVENTLTVLIWVGFVNFYNFMDGIDGITGVETGFLGLGLAAVALIATVPFEPALPLIIAFAGFGFLVPNWRPARIFLGDVGSVPLGFLFGFLLLSLLREGLWLPAIVLPLYYLADAGLTLARRAIALKPVWKAHREHFYQRAAYATDRHDLVAMLVGACNSILIAVVLLGELSGYRAIALMIALIVVVGTLLTMSRLARPTTA